MAAVSPAGPEPMMSTLCNRGSFIIASVPDRARLERRLSVLHVHAELHFGSSVPSYEGIPVLPQGVLEFLVGEAVQGLAALALELHELLVDGPPLRRLAAGPVRQGRKRIGLRRGDHASVRKRLGVLQAPRARSPRRPGRSSR